MKIIELKSKNVKRLKAVRIRPDGTLVHITGKNGAGKSSVLDSIMMALSGKESIPDKPIREGESKARVELDLGDIKVIRTWTDNDKTYLTVENKDGARYPSPQAMLDRLVGKLSFDPLAFARMDAKTQAETLRTLVGLDFFELDEKRKKTYQDRTMENRHLKALQVKLDSMPDFDDDIPDKEICITTLLDELKLAEQQKRQNDKQRRHLRNLLLTQKEMIKKIDKLQTELASLQDDYDLQCDEVSELTNVVNALMDPDTDAISEKVTDVEIINRKVRQKQANNGIALDITKSTRKIEKLNKALADIEVEKQKALSEADFPVANLCFDESHVIFNNIPFSQLSSGEQLSISVAMGLALNPKLKVMLIRDGSLLDSEGLKAIGEMAEDANAQVWIERVSDGEKVGIVIEDGEIAGAETGQGES